MNWYVESHDCPKDQGTNRHPIYLALFSAGQPFSFASQRGIVSDSFQGTTTGSAFVTCLSIWLFAGPTAGERMSTVPRSLPSQIATAKNKRFLSYAQCQMVLQFRTRASRRGCQGSKAVEIRWRRSRPPSQTNLVASSEGSEACGFSIYWHQLAHATAFQSNSGGVSQIDRGNALRHNAIETHKRVAAEVRPSPLTVAKIFLAFRNRIDRFCLKGEPFLSSLCKARMLVAHVTVLFQGAIAVHMDGRRRAMCFRRALEQVTCQEGQICSIPTSSVSHAPSLLIFFSNRHNIHGFREIRNSCQWKPVCCDFAMQSCQPLFGILFFQLLNCAPVLC